MSITDLARLMFRRAVTQRAENPPTESTKLRVEALEDRNAPGSLLGEILAAARGESVPNPLDQMGWLLPSAAERPVADLRPQVPTIRISAATAPEPAATARPELVGPQAREGGHSAFEPLPSVSVRLSMSDEDMMFLPAAQPAFHAAALAGATGMAASAGDGSTTPATPRSSGGTASAAPEPTGSGATFILAPNAFGDVRQPGTTSSNVNPAFVVGQPGSDVNAEGHGAALGPDDEAIANAIPVANNDSAWALEDGFVVIDVLANDTDTDVGDVVLIDFWDSQSANGTITQDTAGKLTYTPFPDFNGTDTFTYVATDGRDVSNTATVTVTVNSVNDLPTAFNDAFRFTHGSPPYPYYPVPIPYGAVDSGSILGNDSDVDGLPSHVADLDTSGTPGTIAMNMTAGTFTWSGPASFYGETSFRYRAGDYNGGSSDWATVKLWVLPSPFTDGVTSPQPDVFAIGSEARTVNVQDNDSGGTVSVLASRAPAKIVTAFGFDGKLSLAAATAADASFTYKLFAADGTAVATTTVDTPKVDLEIFNGQNGAAVRGDNEDETKIGAFTVVNQNDTDGDAIRDNVDDWVSSRQEYPTSVGVDEVDLMRLTVHRPNVPLNEQKPIRIILPDFPSGVKIYERSDKSGWVRSFSFTVLPAAFNPGFDDDPQPFYDMWVEIFEPQTTLRSVTIMMAYGTEFDAPTDTVKATGVWATQTNARTSGTSLSAGADRPELYRAFVRYGAQLGMQTMSRATDAVIDSTPGLSTATKAASKQRYFSNNMIEIEFTATPQAIYLYPMVHFDLTRTADVKVKVANNQPTHTKPRPAFIEAANDEVQASGSGDTNIDNDVDMYSTALAATTGYGFTNKLYSLDGPGRVNEPWVYIDGTTPVRSWRTQYRGDFFEFARVRIGSGFVYPAPGVQGSRSSDYYNWHALVDVHGIADPINPGNKIWERGDADRNSVGPGHKNIDDFA